MALPLKPQTAPMFDLEDLPPFVDAPEVEELADQLMAKHPELATLNEAIHHPLEGDDPVRLAYLFDTAPFDELKNEVKHVTLGKAMRAGPVWRHLAEVEAVVVIRAHFWGAFDERQRAAMVFHELLHIEPVGVGKVKIHDHSIEEFSAVMRRYGAWLPDRARFINEWAKWESDQGGKPANLDAKRATRTATVDVGAAQLARAVADAQKGKPKAADPDELQCVGDNHVPGCVHLLAIPPSQVQDGAEA